MILLIHILTTFTALFIGHAIFLFMRDSKLTNRINGYLILLCYLLLIAAISGIFLNLNTFSPFHILSIVTISTIPLSLYSIYKKYNLLSAFRGIFYNFLGLNLAFLGALLPMRTIGYKFWVAGLGLKVETATYIALTLFSLGVLTAIYFVYLSIYNKNFFRNN